MSEKVVEWMGVVWEQMVKVQIQRHIDVIEKEQGRRLSKEEKAWVDREVRRLNEEGQA